MKGMITKFYIVYYTRQSKIKEHYIAQKHFKSQLMHWNNNFRWDTKYIDLQNMLHKLLSLLSNWLIKQIYKSSCFDSSTKTWTLTIRIAIS